MFERVKKVLRKTTEQSTNDLICEDNIAVEKLSVRNWRSFTQDHFIRAVIAKRADFDDFYSMLSDEESRIIFDWIVGYRFLAGIFGELKLWENMPNPSPLYKMHPGSISIEEVKKGYDWVINNAESLPEPLDVYGMWHTFYLEHYEIKGICQVESGDIVFDIGGYIGDTAVYFGKKVLPSGHVYTFEPNVEWAGFIRENLKKFQLENVTIVPYCLSDKPATHFMERADSFSSSEIQGATKVEAITVDDYVKENNIEHLDLMKLDIEGAERFALLGARQTIEQLRPKIALSIYHGGESGYGDFYELPELVRDLCRDYSFYLRHKNACLFETVLFCIPN